MSLSWTDAAEWKPQGKEGVWGPGRGWKKWRSLREPKSSGQGLPACSTWILTLEAGQIGILRFGFQQVWEPCIAVAEPTALRGGVSGRSVGQGNPSFQPAMASSPLARLTLQSRTRIQLVWAQGRCS